MRITSLKRLMNNTSDQELLDIYNELESGKIPSTSYAHEFCRKVNRMIDDGDLCVKTDGFRHIYLPSLRKLVYKEMARRYFCYLTYYKGEATADTPDVGDITEDDDVCKCDYCNGDFSDSDLIPTDLGRLCETCITAIRSRGDLVATYK